MTRVSLTTKVGTFRPEGVGDRIGACGERNAAAGAGLIKPGLASWPHFGEAR